MRRNKREGFRWLWEEEVWIENKANKKGSLLAWLCLARNHHGSYYLLIKFLSNSFVCEDSLLNLCMWAWQRGTGVYGNVHSAAGSDQETQICLWCSKRNKCRCPRKCGISCNGQAKVAGKKWMDGSLRVILYVCEWEHMEIYYGDQGSPH